MAGLEPWPVLRSPRQVREIQRLRHASVAVQPGKNSAMAATLAQISAAFDEAAAINDFKIRVERLLRLGPHHSAVRARFGARAELLLGRSLEAVITVERWWRDERKAFQIASALGCGTRLSLDVLSEMRLILRLMRFKRMNVEYAAVVEALCETVIPAAAE